MRRPDWSLIGAFALLTLIDLAIVVSLIVLAHRVFDAVKGVR